MKHLTILLIYIYSSISHSYSQTDIQGIKDCIHTFFEGMHNSDTSMMRQSLDEAVVLSTISEKNGQKILHQGTIDQLLQSIAQFPPYSLYEVVGDIAVNGDSWIANATMPYSFYLKESLLHCGTNSFTLTKKNDSWHISQVTDSRYNTPCPIDEARQAIDNLITNWHHAASVADSASYFDLMTVDARFIGTDKTENWSKEAFLTFAAPYFAKGKAWDFKTIDRNVYSDDYRTIAWFDETLDTWMGVCRGSGIVTRVGIEWKIKHYVLSMTINNDKVRQVIELHEK